MYISTLMCWACLSVAADSGKPQSAVEELAKLQQAAHAAHVSGDKQARVDAVLKIVNLLNDAPDALEALAQAYVEAGDDEHALAALRRFADLGQADDSLLRNDDKKFTSIKQQPQYQAILKRFAENEKPVSRAEQAFELADPGLLAEDVDYDLQSHSFLITSVLEKKIIRVAPDGHATDFAFSPSHWPMLAVKVDSTRNLVWATEVALDGFTVAPKSDWGRSAVLCFDLRTGALRQRLEAPLHAAMGDMVLTRQGVPVVSDGNGGGIYRVVENRLERIDDGAFISPQTSTMHPDGKQVFVPDYARGIGLLDPATRQVKWLDQSNHAINGIDGLYFDHGSLLATQNGTSPERVVRFQLDPSLRQIVSEEIIERSVPALGDPTHGVVVGEFFYYIANSGWSSVDEHGDLKTGSRFTSARIMKYRIRRGRS